MPVELARQVYEREDCARSFGEDVAMHLAHPDGIVHKSSAVFYLARPVCYREGEDCAAAMVDPAQAFPQASWNCWHIYLLAGTLKVAVRQFPFRLNYVSWERHNRLRVYPFDRFIQHLT